MHTLRTRFKRDIVAEFLPPKRLLGKISSQKSYIDDKAEVIINCVGMPGVPSGKQLLEFWSKKGNWVFQPRYRGSWESGGEFLKISPEQDILYVVEQLPKGFKSIGNGKSYKLMPKKVILVGNSFGGPAALLASREARIDKVICVSPVVDWQELRKTEPLDFLYEITKEAFGRGYVLNKKYWNKLKQGKFYNPINHTDEIDGSKVLIFHTKDDEVVGYKPVEKFAKKTEAKLKLYKWGGHLSSSVLTRPRYYKQVKKFLNFKSGRPPE